jgi:hypothetical protein
MTRWLPWLALLAVIVGFVNFFWFIAESRTLGGDALNGFVRGGSYFVVEHGTATEVSRSTWEWSRIHGASIFITHPLALAGLAYLLVTQFFPKRMGITGGAARTESVQRVLRSGSAIASARTGGRLGDLRATRPLVLVTVYPAGVVIKPVLMTAFAIPAERIRAVGAIRVLGTSGISIEHDEPDLPSRVWLYLGETDPVARAVRDLATRVSPVAPATPSPGGPVDVGRPATIWEGGSPVMRATILASFVLVIPFAVIWQATQSFGPIGTVFLGGIVLANVYYFFVRRVRP